MITVPANAQETEEPPELITDRPDQTESSTIIPAGSLQAEVGVTIENEKKGGIKSSALTIPAGLFRYGVSNSFELRLIVEYQSATETPDGGEGVTQSGINDIALGGKFKLFEENGFLPDAALNLHLHLPADSTIGRPKVAVPDFRFLLSHTLSDMFSISYNLGMEWDGDSPQGSIIYTAALAASFTDKLGGYAEVFGSKHYEDPTVSAAFDCGLTYLLAPNLQLDAEFGVPVTSNGAPFFIGFGAVLRIPK